MFWCEDVFGGRGEGVVRRTVVYPSEGVFVEEDPDTRIGVAFYRLSREVEKLLALSPSPHPGGQGLWRGLAWERVELAVPLKTIECLFSSSLISFREYA